MVIHSKVEIRNSQNHTYRQRQVNFCCLVLVKYCSAGYTTWVKFMLHDAQEIAAKNMPKSCR